MDLNSMPKLDLEMDMVDDSGMIHEYQYIGEDAILLEEDEDEEEEDEEGDDDIIVDDMDDRYSRTVTLAPMRFQLPASARLMTPPPLLHSYPPPPPAYIRNRKKGVRKEDLGHLRKFDQPTKIRAKIENAEYMPITVQFEPELIHPIPDTEGMPYCDICHHVLRSWPGYEFHVFSVHLLYRPFQCIMCPEVSFHTELEGRFHMTHVHPTSQRTPLLKLYDFDKEDAYLTFFENVIVVQGQGEDAQMNNIDRLRRISVKQMKKFSRGRFQIPYALKATTLLREFSQQTGMECQESDRTWVYVSPNESEDDQETVMLDEAAQADEGEFEEVEGEVLGELPHGAKYEDQASDVTTQGGQTDDPTNELGRNMVQQTSQMRAEDSSCPLQEDILEEQEVEHHGEILQNLEDGENDYIVEEHYEEVHEDELEGNILEEVHIAQDEQLHQTNRGGVYQRVHSYQMHPTQHQQIGPSRKRLLDHAHAQEEDQGQNEHNQPSSSGNWRDFA